MRPKAAWRKVHLRAVHLFLAGYGVRHLDCADNMEKTPLYHILITVQGPVVSVIGVGRNEDIIRSGYLSHRYNHWRVGEHFPTGLKSELDEISRTQKIHVYLDAYWTVGGLGPGHEIPEKWNPCPRWRTVGGIDVIPAILRSKIHDSGSGIEALRCEIGAVAANLTEIIEGRIAAVGPLMGVGHCRPAVIWEQLNHTTSPPFRLFYACRHFVDTA